METIEVTLKIPSFDVRFDFIVRVQGHQTQSFPFRIRRTRLTICISRKGHTFNDLPELCVIGVMLVAEPAGQLSDLCTRR